MYLQDIESNWNMGVDSIEKKGEEKSEGITELYLEAIRDILAGSLPVEGAGVIKYDQERNV